MSRKLLMAAFIAALALVVGTASVFAGGSKEQQPAAQKKASNSSVPIVLKWWDWSDSYAPYTRKTFAEYEKQHPGVKVQYQLFTISQYKSNILLAIRSGDTPDVFPIPAGFSFMQVLKSKWYQPVNKYIEKQWPGGLAAWKKRYPATSFVDGVNTWKGNIYVIPNKYPAGNTALLFYNKTLMQKAGLDPNNPPKTWAELRADAQAITKAGNGKFYGIIMGGKQLNRWGADMGTLASTAGPVDYNGNPWDQGLNLHTGRYDFQNQAFVGALNLFKEMKQDGSFYPGFLSINAPQARSLFGLGKAGFMFQGQWCVGVWRKNNPNLKFGAVFAPVPASGRKGFVHSALVASAGDPFGLSATSKHPSAAAALLVYRSTEKWLSGYTQTGDGYAPIVSIDTSANIKDPLMLKIFKMSRTDMRVAPFPIVRNPSGVGQALLNMKPVHPNFDEILQGGFVGKVDYKSAAKTLSDQMNSQLDQAVSAAKAKGVKVARSDWVFPNWDPLKSYTAQDYQALK